MRCGIRDCAEECHIGGALCDVHMAMVPERIHQEIVEARDQLTAARVRASALVAVMEGRPLNETEATEIRLRFS
jgi:hypothetical protein